MGKSPTSAPTEPQTDYAKKIIAQLQKDRLKPPQWPADPGNPANASAMEAFWIAYGNYRDKVRESLVKAGLIDDPKVRKRLDEAIDFKGICEEMCPEYEKIERIFQHNVMMAEKAESPDGTMWPSPPLMVKALTRSSAGQEAPLPMDVRTVSALKRTLDHLIDDVLGDDSRLPAVHNFLWDRTRAIRRDFIFHSNMSEEEMRQQIYCFETITRFHATSLHLLSQKGFAPEGFDQRQEREQLSKALLSLLQAYDDCKDRQITCPNECEFRAYFILLNAHDPNFQHKVAEWGMDLWYESDDVQTAMTLAQAMQSVWDWRGPIKPTAPTTTALGAFATFFRIVESPQVSYTMACLAEMHFVHVRRGILRNMTRAYARARDSPKDLTLAVLNKMLRFDTLDEAWDFVLANKLNFSSEDRATAHLVLDNKSAQISNMPIPQLFSQNLVERKRAGRSLPEALHGTVYEDAKYTPAAAARVTTGSQSSDLFVSQSPPTSSATSTLASTAKLNASQTRSQTQSQTRSQTQSQSQSQAPSPFFQPSTQQPASSAPSLFATTTITTTPASLTPASSATTTPSIFAQKPPSFSTTPAAGASSSSSSIFPQPTPSAATKDATPLLFQTSSNTPTAQTPAPPALFSTSNKSTTPTTSPTRTSNTNDKLGSAAAAPKASSVFDTLPSATAAAATTATKTAAPASSIFSQPLPASTTAASTPPTTGTSFSALFPASAPAPAASLMFPPTAAKTTADPEKPAFLGSSTNTKRTLSSEDSSEDATKATWKATAAPAPGPSTAFFPSIVSAAPPPPPTLPTPTPTPTPKTDLMGDFAKWFVLGDNGIISEFQDAVTEYLVRQTFEQFQHDEAERRRREEDERSWAEALRFKTYNLRVKFFYKWRRIARERALDRRARQARDELKAYRAAKRAEQRAAAEKAAAEERERAAEARRMGSKEVKFLEELGYYGDFGVSSRKRKATTTADGHSHSHAATEDEDEQQLRSRSVSGSMSAVEHDDDHQHTINHSKLPVRSIKEGISNTVSRAKELLVSRMPINGTSLLRKRRQHHRGGSISSIGSIGSMASMASFDDAGSISGDSIHSVQSMRSSFSPDGSHVAYYRRSIPGKSRAHSFFTRVPSGTTAAPPPPTSGDGLAPPPKKMTNFMRYSNKAHQYGFGFGGGGGGSSSVASGSASASGVSGVPGMRQRPASATAMGMSMTSPAPSSSRASFSASVAGGSSTGVGSIGGLGASRSGSGSKLRSSYWRMRAMGMVQMPNKQYLHESLALPMLQDGKRFPGVGNYGLPPVPARNESERRGSGGAAADEPPDDDFSISKDGGQGKDIKNDKNDADDDEEDEQARAQRYTEERLRRTAMPPSRKRLFSGGAGGIQDGPAIIGATSAAYTRVPRVAAAAAAAAAAANDAMTLSTLPVTSPPSSKKARVSASPGTANAAADTSTLSEAERVIREMREMADAMDEGRDWFREQTDLMKSGTSAWDE